jgi:hypothetical protein
MTAHYKISFVLPLVLLNAFLAQVPLQSQKLQRPEEPNDSQLTVRIYTSLGTRSWLLQGARAEAARAFKPTKVQINWVDCTSAALGTACEGDSSRLLTVRILPKALPQTSKYALGAAIWSGDSVTAFIFYDRVLGLGTHTMLVQTILGRVLAHEIAHLLLPHGAHSKLGIMRGAWSADDLQVNAPPFLGLSANSIRLMQAEVSRLSGTGAAVSR